jgi:1,4-alpha-glucan branching enzyme
MMPFEPTIQQDDLDRIIEGTHWNPHSVLGPHPTTVDDRPHLAIRAWLPDVEGVEAVSDSVLWRMTRIREEGLYETLLPDITQAPPYRLRVTRHDGTVTEMLYRDAADIRMSRGPYRYVGWTNERQRPIST